MLRITCTSKESFFQELPSPSWESQDSEFHLRKVCAHSAWQKEKLAAAGAGEPAAREASPPRSQAACQQGCLGGSLSGSRCGISRRKVQGGWRSLFPKLLSLRAFREWDMIYW